MSAEIVLATNLQKILGFLIQDPGRQYLAAEIQSGTKLSKAGVNAGLRALAAKKMVVREARGSVYLYHVDTINHPLLKQLKVLQTVALIQGLIDKMRPLAKKIILFGSCARGEDTTASDIDLFIVTDSEPKVRALAENYRTKRKLQLVCKSPLAYVEMVKKDRVFYEEVARGLVLWEEKA